MGRFNWPTRNYIVSYSYNGIRNRSACKNREGKSIRHTQARIIDPLRWISTRPPRLGQCSSAQGSKFKPKVPPRGFLQRWRAQRILRWGGFYSEKVLPPTRTCLSQAGPGGATTLLTHSKLAHGRPKWGIAYLPRGPKGPLGVPWGSLGILRGYFPGGKSQFPNEICQFPG